MTEAFAPSKLKALIFDLDDTLYLQADYKRSGFRAVATWLAENLGLPANQTYQELEKILLNRGASEPKIFDIFASQRQLPAALTIKMVDVFIAHQPQINCYPGVSSLLVQLRQHYRLGLLTDGRQSSQEKKIEALGLESKVEYILCSDRLGLNKPAPQLYAWFEDRLQLSGQQLAYIGDNPKKDFLGANLRTWQTIRVLAGEHSLQQACGIQQANVTLSTVTDLPTWLGLTP